MAHPESLPAIEPDRADTPARATAVLILGMHRSGTSALSRVLNLQGLDIASRLVPASENNRTGFWESEELVALQDELLERFGQRWHDIPPLPPGWWDAEPATGFRQRLLDYLERDFGHSSSFLIKDPRLCRLLPLWRSVLDDFGARIKVVLVLRNPLEVAASLEARQGLSIPTAHALQLWLRYSLEAEYHSRGLPRCFVSYEELLNDWSGTLNGIARQLDLTWPRSEAETGRAVGEFLSNGQRHQHAGDDELGTHGDVPLTVRQAYQALQGLAADPRSAECCRVLDEVLAQSDKTALWLAPLLTEHERRLRQEREAQRQLAEQLQASRAETRQMERYHQYDIERLKARHTNREEQLRQQRQELEEKITLVREQASELRGTLEQLQRDFEVEKGEKSKLELELRAIVGSRSWRLTTPLRSFGDWLLSVRGGQFAAVASFGVDRKELECYRLLADSGLYDREYYLENHQDIRDAGMDPLVHFIRSGAAEGRRPNPLFETAWYLQAYPDVADSGLNPLLHYFLHGVAEGRDPSPYFDTLDYLERHPELRESDVNPLAHCLANDAVEDYLPVKRGGTSLDPVHRKLVPVTRAPKGGRQRSLFSDFSGYERNSIFLLKLDAPFTEEAKRVLGYMHGMRRHLAQRHARLPDTTLVSIIMPTYNRAACIGNAVRSALAQSYPTFELIVVDDGGEDDTAAVIEAFNDPRIQYFRLEQNQGAAAARNLGLERAQGEFITYLDSDNTMEPDFLRILLGELLATQRADMVYCAQNIHAGDSGSGAARLEAVRYATFSRSVLENRNYIDLGVLLHRRALIERSGGFNEQMQRLIDWEFLLRLSERQAPKAIPCVLSNYHHGAADNQITKLKSFNRALAHIDRYLARRTIAERLPGHEIPGLEEMYSPLSRPAARYQRKISIIIPSYECLDYLRLCIDSVQRFTPQPHELIIVDNASAEPVRRFLAEPQERIRVIQNEHNYGFTHAVNQGIACADPASDILLLNNDAVVTEGWVTAMQQVFDDLPEAGLIVPRQVLPANTPTIEIHNPICNPVRETDVNLSIHHDNIVDPALHYRNGYVELSFAPFFCVYIPRHTLGELGPLDHENGPHYRSDRLYCESVRRIAGRRIVYTPHAKVYHFLQQATATLKQANGDQFDRMFVRNEWSEVEQPDVVE